MSPRSPDADWCLPDRVAYVVSHSYPYSSNGYAVRTHEVARALVGLGHDVVVINRPGRPWSIEGFTAAGPVRSEEIVDGVRYVFLPLAANPEDSRRTRLRRAEAALLEAFGIFRPGVVIGVSNWENAEPAQNAARRHGCAFFYEQRGFWEMSRAAVEPEYAQSEEYQRTRDYELRIARDAAAVFTLNGPMRAEMIRRGVPEAKIHLAPNGVSPPGPIAKGITRKSLGITERHLLGYVGSLSEYEGTGLLVHLVARLRREDIDVGLLIVGSSAPKGLIGSQHAPSQESGLRALAESLGVQAHVHFAAQQSWDRIGAYYTLLDAIVMPRLRSDMTDIVAPLKPYAAAAYGVPFFMTDMPSLAEIAADIDARLFAEGDLDALAGMVRDQLAATPAPAAPDIRASVRWPERVRVMSRLLQVEAAKQHTRMAQVFADGFGPGQGHAGPGGAFDIGVLPQVVFERGAQTLACLGPGRHLKGDGVARLTRTNILAHLATATPGVFVIDWAGLQTQPGDWAGLWSIHDMRLNRLVMTACRIATERGWRCQVTGPVNRSQAPLYRTVAAVLEEVLP
ncbi:glycosyltransferase [Roseovarius sp. M141]|uniref:glycosyltransferase n=1 Tax=Roseovarius sp. M141 TaxID=2583806 RepID=UPI0020CCDA62|nr:glycosyltransferase [Roseovarius sp. M141]